MRPGCSWKTTNSANSWCFAQEATSNSPLGQPVQPNKTLALPVGLGPLGRVAGDGSQHDPQWSGLAAKLDIPESCKSVLVTIQPNALLTRWLYC